MENEDPQLAPPQQAASAPAVSHQIKLPSFWPKDPTPWFRLAEGQFTLHNVVYPVTHYYHVLVAQSTQSTWCGMSFTRRPGPSPTTD
jgi:hypothetical protein